MKKLLLLILLCAVVFAQIEKTSITVSVDRFGSAQVEEELTINTDEKTAESFELLIKNQEAGFDSWKALIDDLKQSIKSIDKPYISATKTGTGESTEYKLAMDYSTAGFSELKSSKGRIEDWEIRNMLFEFYDLETKKMIVPDETYMTIILQDTRKDRTKPASEFFQVTPAKFVQGPYLQDNDKVLFFINGPVMLQDFKVDYKIEKPLSESFSIKDIFTFFSDNPVYIAILVILILLLIAFRKQISLIIEDTFITDENIIMPRDRE